jgi:hypothetical protein
MLLTYHDENRQGTATGLTDEATDDLARSLYEIMEELETQEPAGEPWEALPEAYKPWYRECAVAFLTNPVVLERAKALTPAR